LRFVSRFFRDMIEDQWSKGIFTKVVHRNFVHVLKQFLRFVSVPGYEDIILDNFFNRFLSGHRHWGSTICNTFAQLL
jgi:hypothetical protein